MRIMFKFPSCNVVMLLGDICSCCSELGSNPHDNIYFNILRIISTLGYS
jgi:hypothetical protein